MRKNIRNDNAIMILTKLLFFLLFFVVVFVVVVVVVVVFFFQYVRGELMGGLDILKETASEGSLREDWDIADLAVAGASGDGAENGGAGNSPEESLDDRLRKLVNRHGVMLFMKGLPSNPQCGFSRQIVEILDATGVPYDAFNVFEDEDVRQGLKEFSDWPTYPQLYLNGELLGGLDIVREMQETGELGEMLRGEDDNDDDNNDGS